jgi:mono/diheme cytochrome c family protein
MNIPNRSFLLLICSFVAGCFVLPVIVLSAALLGWLPADAVSAPPLWESRLGQAVLKASLSHRAAGLSNPILGGDAELLAGMAAFKNNCSGCHGDAGAVSHWGNSNFYPRVPQFGQSPPILSAAEMFVAIKHGIRYSGMFANEKMKEEKIWQIATFLSHLNSLPPDIEHAWKEKP